MSLPPSRIWSNWKLRHSIRRPRKPCPRTKREMDRITRCGDMSILNSTYHKGCIRTLIFEEGEVVEVIDRIIRKSDSGFLLALHCDRWPLTIRPQFAIECLRRSNQQGSGSLWVKILGCSLWSRSVMLGSSEREHPMLTKWEIIFQEFQPLWSRYFNVTDRQTDRRTDNLPQQ